MLFAPRRRAIGLSLTSFFPFAPAGTQIVDIHHFGERDADRLDLIEDGLCFSLSTPDGAMAYAHERLDQSSAGYLERLLLSSRVMAARHMTRAATRAPRRALPRRRALCTNSKKPRYSGSFSCEMP